MALPYGADGAAIPVQRFRDAQKLYAEMTDGKMEYVLYGIENQSEIHYAMAVKNNLYDALEYAGQVEEAARSHQREMKRKKSQENINFDSGEKVPGSGEFLSDFWKEDKLIPSVTLTMFFIKYSRNKEKLNEVLESNQRRFQRLEKRAVDVIEAIINAGIKYDEGEVEVDMCQAIQEIREEERRLGELEKTKEAVRNFYEMGIEIEKVAQGVGYTVETVKQWLGLAEDHQ